MKMNKNIINELLNSIEKIFLSVIFLYPLLVSSQTFLVKGKIVDSLNNPIPYTSIFIEKFQIGTNADIEGYFEISVNDLPASMQVSSIGYESRKIVVADDKKNRLIILKSKNTYLDEVVVTAKHNVIKQYDIGTKKSKGNEGYKASYPYQQLALMVKNKNLALYSNAYLDRVSVKIIPRILGGIKPTSEKQLRLRLYIISDNGRVGDDILHENVFLSPSKTGWYELELAHKIQVPEDGFVLALEWIENQKNQKWGKNSHSYGILVRGHKLKKEELDFYSAWIFNPKLQKWGFYNNKETIPCFNIRLIEQQ